jgi:hypothetical protein
MPTRTDPHVVFATGRQHPIITGNIIQDGRQTIRPSLPALRRRLVRALEPRAHTWSSTITKLVRAGLDTGLIRQPDGNFRLTIRDPYIGNRGYLYFFGASEYIPEKNRAIVLMTNIGGGGFFSVAATNVAPGQRLVLDLAVTPGIVLSGIGGGFAVTADSSGHALAVVTANASGFASLNLNVHGNQLYTFYYADVTPLP